MNEDYYIACTCGCVFLSMCFRALVWGGYIYVCICMYKGTMGAHPSLSWKEAERQATMVCAAVSEQDEAARSRTETQARVKRPRTRCCSCSMYNGGAPHTLIYVRSVASQKERLEESPNPIFFVPF